MLHADLYHVLYVGYYGTEDRGSAVDEDSPPVSEFVSDLCQQWEAAAQVDDPDVRSVIVRVGKCDSIHYITCTVWRHIHCVSIIALCEWIFSFG